ncbi:MAG: isoleucine--tRNA ligase, partial [Thermoguttaceae bacterium]
QSYVESVWWALKTLFDRGLLYQGHKIVWWWAQGGTALSAGEVGQGYREVADPSAYVRFPLIDKDETDLLVWTTTPWTLPSNQFAAVKPELEYSVVAVEGESRKLVMASALVEEIAKKSKKELTVESTLSGKQLIGNRYVPPFDYYYKTQGQAQGKLKDGSTQPIAWRVVAADFVTTDTGTGIVHQAPAFGEVDYDILRAEQDRFVDGQGPELINAVGPDGKFTAEAPDYEGRWVKEADKDLSRELRKEGLLFHLDQYLHDYPFCWRAEEDPLIQYPRLGWFIRTTKFKEKMLANNSRINWMPEHIRDGRFGNFLESNVDWALSRERYWGTPLPIWVCEKTGHMEAVAAYDELLAKPGVTGMEVWEKAKQEKPHLPDDLKVHKPYIDAITYDSPKAPGKRMRRVTEVIDCWFDSGAMPFAQWGYPHTEGSAERFKTQFPADFISEALDQTRGWFYSLLAISTLLFSDGEKDPETEADTPPVEYPHPYRNCIVLGLMLGEDGAKMSKSKRNYLAPNEIFNRFGADALRWYFFANQPPWTSIRYSERAIKESIPEFLLTLWNVYSFFVIYANIDGFDPAGQITGEAGQLTSDVLATAAGKSDGYRPIAQRGELDRWMLSELSRTAAAVTERMDAYDNYGACARLTEFTDALSNWYVRRSRDRFWSSEPTADKSDAYWTLYECLVTTSKLIAPFVPFLAEEFWQNLATAAFDGKATESVHLCDYPTGDAQIVDETLSQQMTLVREIVSLGRSARMGAKLKVRQPLSLVEVILADDTHRGWLEDHADLVCDELNVKKVEYTDKADRYIQYTVLPDMKKLGPKLGKRLPALRKCLAQADGGKLLAELEAQGQLTLELPDGPVTLDNDEIQVRLQAKEGWAAAQGHACVVVLSTELTDELIAEGLAREVVRAIQDRRKELDCEYTDRIAVGLVTDSKEIRTAVEQFADYIRGETLAIELGTTIVPDAEPVELKVAGSELTLYVKVASG